MIQKFKTKIEKVDTLIDKNEINFFTVIFMAQNGFKKIVLTSHCVRNKFF